MKINKLIIATAITFSTFSNADILGGSFGFDYLRNTDSNINNKSSASIYASFEHFVPIIPNFKIRYTNFDYTNSTKFVDAELNKTDLILYYEVFDNSLFSIDLGANFQYMDASYGFKDSKNWKPAVYGQALVSMSTPFEIFAEASIGKDNYDAQAGVSWVMDLIAADAKLKLGYRKQEYKKSNAFDHSSENVFLGLEFNF